MKTFKYGKNAVFVIIMLLAIQRGWGATFTVSQDGRGQFKSIQEAVNAAKGINNEIVILDAATYKEQVTIDSLRNGLILRSENPLSPNKPTIVFQDKINVGPTTCEEAKDTSKINFDRNGALQVLGASNVRIEGIAVDGGGPFVFGYNNIWKGNTDCEWPLQHGNAAITLWVSGNTIIRHCDIKNAYFGINVKDRNEGGVFANANPGDVYPENVVPLSGFARTGNHLIEYNRIHNNSFGFFIESSWDMGSTIRYNLIYENHHQSTSFAEKVKSLTQPDGGNQPGGAFMFKDNLLSPLAIYNNTFWHNMFIFIGHWNVGGVHLIFNNIYGPPYKYWRDESVFGNASFLEIFGRFPYRQYNCVIAAQQQAPDANYVAIMNNVQPQRTDNTYEEGALVVGNGTVTSGHMIPASANIRWVETKFLSTDPTSPDFLTPDWSDQLVDKYIKDQGWEPSGVKDPDGTPADLGAIPKGGGRPVDIVTIRPTQPMVFQNNQVNLSFSVDPRIGTMAQPKFVFLRFIRDLTVPAAGASFFGDNSPIIPNNNIQSPTIPATPVKIGANEYMISVQNPGTYAFFEMIIEGIGSDTKPFTSAVGFIPYRKLDYMFEVEVRGTKGGKPITEVQAGQTVYLYVRAIKVGGQTYTNKVDPTSIRLTEPDNKLYDPQFNELNSIPGGVNGQIELEVVFTKVPSSGIEYVKVSGKSVVPAGVLEFFGSSQGVKILPGPADSIKFQDPPSKLSKIVDPGTTAAIKVQAYDRFGNKVGAGEAITCTSVDPNIANIANPEATTDSTGMAIFRGVATNGDKDDSTMIIATLVKKPAAKDSAYLKVGQPRDRLWIFYGDTLKYDPLAGISGCAGIRVPVTIRAGKTDNTISKDRTTSFNIILSSGLAAYESQTSTTPITSSKLVAGEVKIWIQATTKNVSNGQITVSSNEPNVLSGERGNINFEACFTMIEKATYYADNGRGSVDRVEIFYQSALKPDEIPDSILLFWPKAGSESRMVYKQNIKQDPENPAHLTVTIPTPFSEGITRYTESSANLGRTYWFNPSTPDAPTIEFPFAINDGVGPLIASAILIERLVAGNDTLILDFTEPVDYTKVKGLSLTLLKKQEDGSFAEVQLEVIHSQPDTNGRSVIAVVRDLGDNSPKEGDSLKITHTGPIVDGFNNGAHPKNRPVLLTTRKIAPDIVSAVFQDLNADGMIDNVRITFNKAVDPEYMKMQFNWNGKMGLPADKNHITVAGSNNTIDVKISDLFNVSDLKDKTSGNLKVTVLFNDYTINNTKNAVAADGAAPVLTSLEYHFGEYLETTSAADTVIARFSEPIAAIPATDQPLLFAGPGGRSYEIRVENPSVKAPAYVFIVKSSTAEPPPSENDSAWINTAAEIAGKNVVDLFNNAQTNPANKRVPVIIKRPYLHIKVAVGPNPFNPKNPTDASQKKVSISIRARTKVAVKTTYWVSASIYDKVGNVVKKIPDDVREQYANVSPTNEIVSEDSCKISWDGTNRQGRIVGNGTYLAILNIKYKSEGVDVVQNPPQIIKIGVKQ